MRLGIVAAMPAEARTLTKQAVGLGQQILLDAGVSLALSGVGPKRARAAAHSLIAHGATALLSWGSAGGLAFGLSPGTVVLPKTVIAIDRTLCETDALWHARLLGRLEGRVDIRTQPLAESAAVLTMPEEKSALFRKTGAVAVDMESGAVALVAKTARIPFMAVRVISDPADMALPSTALRIFGKSGRLSLTRAATELLRNPIDLFPILRLGLHFLSAKRSLATVARLSGADFLFHQNSPDVFK